MHTPVHCRATVLVPGRRVDVALPVDVPLAELVPLVLELLGELGSTARTDPWAFSGAAGGSLPPEATLGELGVLDGELLRLGPWAPPPPPPVFDDPVDALATLTAPEVEPDRQRTAAVAVLGVALAAAVLLATTRTAQDGSAAHAWGAVLLGGVSAVLALAWAARRRRTSETDEGVRSTTRTGDRSAVLVPAYCAVPLAAAGSWVVPLPAALPGPPDEAHLLLAATAAGTAAALGQAVVRVVSPVLVAVLVVAVPVAAAGAVALQFGVPSPALAAVTGAVALSAGPLLPRVALRFAGLARPAVPNGTAGLLAADSGPDVLPPDELEERATLARGLLTGLSGGCALIAALAAPVAAVADGWTGPTAATVVVTVLLMRAGGLVDPAAARVHLAAAITAGVALVGVAASATGTLGRLVGTLVLLCAAAAVTASLGRDARGTSPVARRAVDLTEGVLTAAAVPLALAAAGVFSVVRAL